MTAPGTISITPVPGLPEIEEGFNLGAAIVERSTLSTGDIIVISQKAVSKSEGRLVMIDNVVPGKATADMAATNQRSAS